MATYEYAGTFRAALLDELAAAGVAVERLEMDGDERNGVPVTTCWVTTEADEAAVAAVVAAHDASAIDAAREADEAADEADRLTLREVVAVLVADAARLEDTTVTLSPQVIRNHLARTDRVLAATLRYLRRRGM
jgi:hypothetical protein